MDLTPIFNFKKPTGADLADLRVFIGDNLDLIEAELQDIKNQSGSGGGISLNQSTKLGVLATEENPHMVTLTIPRTTSFARLPVEVLKFIPSNETHVITAATFSNGESDDFEENNVVTFDGTMRLKTTDIISMTKDTTWIESGGVFVCTIDKSNYKVITSIKEV